jgi:signal transduction histidine kinase
VAYGDSELAVDVLDEGGEVPTRRSAGRGLAGMRERVALYGGVLEVGPHADGGFCVSARFPVATP